MKIKKIINATLIQREQVNSDSFFEKLNETISSIQDNGNEAILHFNSTSAGLAILVEEVTYVRQKKLKSRKDDRA